MTELPPHAISILSRLDLVADNAAYDGLLDRLKNPQSATTVAFVNAHAVNIIWNNAEIAEDFAAADVILRDGKGLEMLFEKIGVNPGLNMNGTDFLPAFLRYARELPLAVYGTADPWLSIGCDKLQGQGHIIAARFDGFQPVEEYVANAIEAKPKIILLAMGMPKQERVARALRAALVDQPVTIVCGGAIVDFLAERFQRAPSWMRRTGLEWAYRLFREPRRLFRRYVIGTATFLWHIRQIVREGGLAKKK